MAHPFSLSMENHSRFQRSARAEASSLETSLPYRIKTLPSVTFLFISLLLLLLLLFSIFGSATLSAYRKCDINLWMNYKRLACLFFARNEPFPLCIYVCRLLHCSSHFNGAGDKLREIVLCVFNLTHFLSGTWKSTTIRENLLIMRDKHRLLYTSRLEMRKMP